MDPETGENSLNAHVQEIITIFYHFRVDSFLVNSKGFKSLRPNRVRFFHFLLNSVLKGLL